MNDTDKIVEKRISKVVTKMTLQGKHRVLSKEIFVTPKILTEALPTMATDGNTMLISPTFAGKLNDEELEFCLCHEAMHQFKLDVDPNFLKNRNKVIANIAMDATINSMLCKAQIGKIPDGCVASDSNGNVTMDYVNKGKTIKIQIEEAYLKGNKEVYDIIDALVPKKDQPTEEGEDGSGDKDNTNPNGFKDMHGKPIKYHHKFKELTDADRADHNRKIRRVVMENALKSKGTGTGDILEEVMASWVREQVNWKVELKNAIIPLIKDHKTFARMNRKQSCHDIIIKGSKRTGVDVAVALDTSGSIGETEFNYFMGELKNIYNSFPMGSVNMKIYLHTDQVYSTIQMGSRLDVSKLKVTSGGTSHIPLLELAEKENTKCLICLTDGATCYPMARVKIPKMVWLYTCEEGKTSCPVNIHGRKLVIDVNQSIRKLMGE